MGRLIGTCRSGWGHLVSKTRVNLTFERAAVHASARLSSESENRGVWAQYLTLREVDDRFAEKLRLLAEELRVVTAPDESVWRVRRIPRDIMNHVPTTYSGKPVYRKSLSKGNWI